MAHAGGRPTKYRKEYCKTIIEFFCISPTKTLTITTKTAKGVKRTAKKEVAVPLPTIEGFAIKLGVCKDTVLEWVKEYPEFSGAYKRAKAGGKEVLVQNGLTGRYAEGFAKFVAINCTDMVDKSSLEVHDSDVPLFDDSERALLKDLCIARAKKALEALNGAVEETEKTQEV